jgi:hypothetical protein
MHQTHYRELLDLLSQISLAVEAIPGNYDYDWDHDDGQDSAWLTLTASYSNAWQLAMLHSVE